MLEVRESFCRVLTWGSADPVSGRVQLGILTFVQRVEMKMISK